MKAVFWWAVAAGFLNGMALWIRERMKEEQEEEWRRANEHL